MTNPSDKSYGCNMEHTNHHRHTHPKDTLSKIIHDMKTPLNIIMMSSEMLARKVEPTADQVHRHSAKIKESVLKLDEIIERLRHL